MQNFHVRKYVLLSCQPNYLMFKLRFKMWRFEKKWLCSLKNSIRLHFTPSAWFEPDLQTKPESAFYQEGDTSVVLWRCARWRIKDSQDTCPRLKAATKKGKRETEWWDWLGSDNPKPLVSVFATHAKYSSERLLSWREDKNNVAFIRVKSGELKRLACPWEGDRFGVG